MTRDPSSDYKSDAGTAHSDLFPALIITTEKRDKTGEWVTGEFPMPGTNDEVSDVKTLCYTTHTSILPRPLVGSL